MDPPSCPLSQDGTTDSHRDRGLRSSPAKDPRRGTTTEESAMTHCTRSLRHHAQVDTITAAVEARCLMALQKRHSPILAHAVQSP